VSDLATKPRALLHRRPRPQCTNRAVVASPDGTSSVQDIVSASDASKFYHPFGSAGYSQRSVDPVTQGRLHERHAGGRADPTQTNDYIYDKLVAGGTTP